MNTKKLKLTTLFIAFAVLIASLVGVFVSLFSVPATAATYATTSIFASSANGSVSGEKNDYTSFTFKGEKDNAVNYNRNLAYKWFTKETGAEPVANYFSMKFAFGSEINFETFTIAFQAAENSKSDDGVTENEIVFFNDNGSYSVAIRNNDDKDKTDADLTKTAITTMGDIEVKFSAGAHVSEYAVNVKVGTQDIPVATFTNVRGSYAKYVTSKVIPLSFTAKVATDKEQVVKFQELNGQSFLLDGESKVVDNKEPVLVVNEDIKNFLLGYKLFDFSYEVIDVCDSTVTRDTTYYQYNPEATEESYKTLTSTVRIFDKYTFKTDAKEYVSIRFKLHDDENNEATYDLSWYASDRTNDVTKKGEIEYLSVIIDKAAPVYTCIDTVGTTQTLDTENQALVDYKADVVTAAADLSAGEGRSFYLPSLEELIADGETAYSGLTFTIYYRTESGTSTSTRSNVAYDDLDIPVSSAGQYEFKVVASDESGNKIAFYDEDGNLVTVSTDNIWDLDQIPSFTFKVENRGLTVEETEELSYAYMYSNYTVESFEIKAVPGYASNYALYYIEGVNPNSVSYADMVAFANYCYENDVDENNFVAKLREWSSEALADAKLNEISKFNDKGPANEDEDGWDTHENRYEWRTSSLSFTPQESGFYLVRAELVDKEIPGVKYAYKVVFTQSEKDQTSGQTYWIENNIVTVVFIVIAALAAIALLVIAIVFPSGETVETAKANNAPASGRFSGRRKSSDADETDKK